MGVFATIKALKNPLLQSRRNANPLIDYIYLYNGILSANPNPYRSPRIGVEISVFEQIIQNLPHPFGIALDKRNLSVGLQFKLHRFVLAQGALLDHS